MLSTAHQRFGQLTVSAAAPLALKERNINRINITTEVIRLIESLKMDLLPEVIEFINKKNCLDAKKEEDIPLFALEIGVLNELTKSAPDGLKVLRNIGESHQQKSIFYNPLSYAIQLLYNSYKNKQESLYESLTKKFNATLSLFYHSNHKELVLSDNKNNIEHFSFLIHFVIDQSFLLGKEMSDQFKKYIKTMIDQNNADPLEKLFIYYAQDYAKEIQKSLLRQQEINFERERGPRFRKHVETIEKMSSNDHKIPDLLNLLKDLWIRSSHSNEHKTISFAASLIELFKNHTKVNYLHSPILASLYNFMAKDKKMRIDFNKTELSEESIDQCYAILELPPNTNFETTKIQFRKLILKYHPDKSSNLPSEDAKKANDKYLNIFSAFGLLKEHYEKSQVSDEAKLLQEKKQEKEFQSFKKDMSDTLIEFLDTANKSECKLIESIFEFVANAWESDEENSNEDLEQDKLDDESESKFSMPFRFPEPSLEDIVKPALTKFNKDFLAKCEPLEAEIFLIQQTIAELIAWDNEIRLAETEWRKDWDFVVQTNWKCMN